MALKTVTGKLTDGSGNAVPYPKVRATLSAPAVIANTQEVAPAAVPGVGLADGTWSIVLQSNLDLTPNTTSWHIEVGSTWDCIAVVQSSAGPFPVETIMAAAPAVSPPAALDSAVVHLALSEMITGVKDLSLAPRVKLWYRRHQAWYQKTNLVNPQPIQPIIKATLSPAQVAAGAKAVTQNFTVPAIQAGDTVVGLQKATQQAGLEIVGWDIPSAGHLEISFSNPTAAPITPTATEVYTVTVNRQSQASPAITLGTSGGATMIPSSALVPADSGQYLYSGAGTMGFGTGFPDTHFYAPRTPFTLTDSPTGLQQFCVHFMFDGDRFEFITKGYAGGLYRIKVDGLWVQPTATSGPNVGDGADWRILVDFGSKAVRRIQLRFNGGTMPFGGVQCLPTYTVWPPKALAYRAIFFGDSEVFSSSDGPGRQWGEVVSDLLGWEDIIISSAGGTGYLQAGSKSTFRGRVQNDLINMAPDVVVIMGGQNDGGNFTNAAIQAEATLLLQTIQAALPNCQIFGVGPCYFPGNVGQSGLTAALAAGYAAATNAEYPNGVPFFDTVNDPAGRWFTGTGKVGATNGTGNSDFYISNDGIHPSQAGHDYIGLRLASSILNSIPSL